MPPPDAPLVIYFRHHEGRWRGRFTAAITDGDAFKKAGLPWATRLRLRLMSLSMRLVGPMTMTTRVDASRIEDGVVVHWTWLRSFGITVMSSIETFRLADDGLQMTLERDELAGPPGFRTRSSGVGSAAIRPEKNGVHYDLPWSGGRLEQTTEREGDDLTVTQRNDWFRGEVRLSREREASP
jgi:hypothetical protein